MRAKEYVEMYKKRKDKDDTEILNEIVRLMYNDFTDELKKYMKGDKISTHVYNTKLQEAKDKMRAFIKNVNHDKDKQESFVSLFGSMFQLNTLGR